VETNADVGKENWVAQGLFFGSNQKSFQSSDRETKSLPVQKKKAGEGPEDQKSERREANVEN